MVCELKPTAKFAVPILRVLYIHGGAVDDIVGPYVQLIHICRNVRGNCRGQFNLDTTLVLSGKSTVIIRIVCRGTVGDDEQIKLHHPWWRSAVAPS